MPRALASSPVAKHLILGQLLLDQPRAAIRVAHGVASHRLGAARLPGGPGGNVPPTRLSLMLFIW